MAMRTTLVAASLFAITLFCAFGVLAANPDVVYQTTFNPNTPILGDVKIRLQNDSINPLMIFALNPSGIKKPLSFEVSHREISISSNPFPNGISQILVVYRARLHNDSLNRARVYTNNNPAPGGWTEPSILIDVGLTDIYDSLSIGFVGAIDTHTVIFTTNTFPIADSGAVWVNFPDGFNIVDVGSVIYSDNDTTNDAPNVRPIIESISKIGSSVVFRFAPGRKQAVSYSQIRLKFWTVKNDTIAQERSVLVMTTNSNGEIENDLASSVPFTLFPGPVTHIAIKPDTAMTLQAGSLVNFQTTGYDRYNNILSNIIFTYDVTVDSCGDIVDGAFRAHKLGQTYVTASASSLIDSSGLLTITPGPLGRFEASGYPASVTAGSPFQNAIVVTAFDTEGNRKTNYLGDLWFGTGDTLADLPYRVSNPFHFQAGDAGQVSFPGSGFVLRTVGTGISTIQATNGTIGVISPQIRVLAATINHFTLFTGPSHVAGEGFLVTVSNARDVFGNLAAGTIIISDSVGAGNSPNGTTPTFSSVTVSSGTGSALQTLVRAGSGIILKGVYTASVRAATDPFTVLPGAFGSFTLAGYPDTVGAGSTFIPPVRVHVSDIYGNAKSNYIGQVYFESSDPLAVLPYTSSSPCNFVGSDSAFAGSRFSLRTSGRQTITVTDGVFSATSNIITVTPAAITAFSLSAPGSAVAGTPFSASVSGAHDVWGNAANGTIGISAQSGGGPSPNGTQPSYSPITVINGSGSALQTLFNVNSTVLRGVTDTVVSLTAPIAVAPGTLGGFTMNGFPDTTYAGVPFTSPINVHVSDIFGNAKTNYNGLVYFTSTDPAAILPYTSGSRCNFVGSDSSFAGDRFSLRTAGRKTITITDGALSTPSNIITVKPAPITAFNLSAPQNAVAGTPFSAIVSGAFDVWGNPANGTVTISALSGGGSSPNGTQPIYSPITVVEGSGSALQTLFNVNTTVLRGMANSVVSMTGPIAVAPGPLGGFITSGFPDTADAGTPFESPVNVHVSDIFGNAKTNYNGTVYFTSTDPLAILPYTFSAPCNFVGSDSSFAGTRFTLRTVGRHTISVTDGAFSTPSNFITVRSTPIIEFELSAPFNTTAGVPFSVNVSNARDAWGNAANGVVTIATASGGGPSPNGTQPAFSPITVINGAGTANQTLFNAVTTVLQGTTGIVVVQTAPISVAPGTLGGFTLTGCPDTVGAGTTFIPSVAVHVLDIFGNAKSNYSGLVYFESSDPLAVLPYTSSSPCNFVGSDSVFAGSRFSLRTAGRQTITVTDSVFSATSNIIAVTPAAITAFSLTAPNNVVAGTPFLASVTGAQDAWGNAANGTVGISAQSGGGPSPNGTQPSYSSITVVNGSGNAQQTLFNVNSTVLKGVIESVEAFTDPIAVAPGLLGGFNFVVSSPQVTGVPFRNLATLTTLDRYGNLKTDFDASTDSVVITSTSGGQLSNNIFRSQTDFNQGVADLVAKGTTYRGLGGLMSFQAASRSNVSGLSNQVDMNAIRCVNFNIDQSSAAQGDTITGSISVNNVAGRNVTITGLSVIDDLNWLPQIAPDSALPVTIDPGVTRVFSFTLPIPEDLIIGFHRLTAAAFGAFGIDNVADTLSGFPDSIRVQPRSTLSYVVGTINPDTLSSGLYYSLSFRMINTGTSALALYDSSYLTFTDNTTFFRADLAAPAYLTPNNPVLLTLESALVPLAFIPGSYTPTFHYFGNENGNFRSGQVNLADPILVQSGSVLSYAGNLNIDSLVGGQNAAFSIVIQNNGQADFIVRHQATRLSFNDSQREYIAYSDTSTGVRTDTLHSGPTLFRFSQAQLPANFTTGNYLPLVILSGRQNGNDTSFTFSTGIDSVKVVSPAQIQIDSTYAMSRNAPFVNTSQPCSLKVLMENMGDERANSFYMHLSSTGGSDFPDSIFVPFLDGHHNLAVIFPITASSVPNPNEIFASSISGGTGSMSGNPALINPPVDNNSLLITETPAELWLSQINIIAPPGALDSTISIDQVVTLSVTVINLGQAAISGPRNLTFYPGDISWGVDSLQRDYMLGLPTIWQVTAPSIAIDSAGLSIGITGSPIDENDGSTALGQSTVSLIWFTIEDRASIEHHASITDSPGARDGIVSTDQTFIISDYLEPHGLYRSKVVRLNLPDNFTTQDSLVKYPAGDTVTWHLRAPSSAAFDTAEISCWIYDLNRGDSAEASTVQSIPIRAVDAARLNLTASIVGPQSSLDGIIEPGGHLVFQAIVRNLGQAGVSSGRLELSTGRTDMTIIENPIRDFYVDIPLSWTINVPNEEIPLPIPIWVTIEADPVEENTNLPAHVVDDSAGVTIVVRELYPKLILSNISGHSGSVVKGQSVDFVSFELQNHDFGGNFAIDISGLTFRLRSTPQVAASEIFSFASLVSDSRTLNAIDLSDSAIVFSTTDTIRMEASAQVPFTLTLGIRPDVAIRDFSVGFGANLVQAVIIENGLATEQVNAISIHGEAADWQGDPTMILEPNFTASLSSYPNPFSPQTGTTIGYYLPTASDLEIRIFTLLGELVWTKTISSAEPLGTAGLHTGSNALSWNATNDLGREIRSGVYICLVRNLTSGEEAKFKIAVVK